MGHHHYSDSEIGEEREFYGVQEPSEGEREYYEHVRTPRASMINSAITVSAILLVLSIAFGYHMTPGPTAAIESATASRAMGVGPSDSCAEVSPYSGKEC